GTKPPRRNPDHPDALIHRQGKDRAGSRKVAGPFIFKRPYPPPARCVDKENPETLTRPGVQSLSLRMLEGTLLVQFRGLSSAAGQPLRWPCRYQRCAQP